MKIEEIIHIYRQTCKKPVELFQLVQVDAADNTGQGILVKISMKYRLPFLDTAFLEMKLDSVKKRRHLTNYTC